MKEIKLSQNQIALVDNQDYIYLSKWNWHAVWSPDSQSYYAARTDYINGKKINIRMHRVIMGVVDEKIFVDHINHKTLDNRRFNLRLASIEQNNMNKKLSRVNTSGYKGVAFHKATKKWRAYINNKNKQLHLGLFNTAEEASIAYEIKAKELFGAFKFEARNE